MHALSGLLDLLGDLGPVRSRKTTPLLRTRQMDAARLGNMPFGFRDVSTRHPSNRNIDRQALKNQGFMLNLVAGEAIIL
jgi:hypothetical protein